jgi:hypothetical protein
LVLFCRGGLCSTRNSFPSSAPASVVLRTISIIRPFLALGQPPTRSSATCEAPSRICPCLLQAAHLDLVSHRSSKKASFTDIFHDEVRTAIGASPYRSQSERFRLVSPWPELDMFVAGALSDRPLHLADECPGVSVTEAPPNDRYRSGRQDRSA